MDKRIAIFVPTLQFGGAERVALNLASGFLHRGFSVDILVASDRGTFRDVIPPGARLYSRQQGADIACVAESGDLSASRVALVCGADYGPHQRCYGVGALASAYAHNRARHHALPAFSGGTAWLPG